MCVLFFAANPDATEEQYKLILINNRDEFFTRPTKVADFWESDRNIIGGMDMEPGKEGGTWLAMRKNGKIAVLLNILQPVSFPAGQLKGRGFLVPGFLQSDEPTMNYLEELHAHCHEYNTFNFVTLDLNSQSDMKFEIGHYTNTCHSEPTMHQPGFHGFGNSPPDIPWRKIKEGKSLFVEIIEKHKNIRTKEPLIKECFDFLNNDTPYYPDHQLIKQGEGRSEDVLTKLSALGVKIPSIKYGTRTNTVILVDGLNQVTFIERTMQEPIDANSPEWVTRTYSFVLDI